MRADRNAHVHARGITVPLTGTPDVGHLADWIDETAAAHDVSVLSIDGPLGWQGPDTPALHGSVHSRLSEQRLLAPGKTGLPPDGVKPRPYLGFTRFSIVLFELLTERGWVLPAHTHPTGHHGSIPRKVVTESFPTAAWRALGLTPLIGKARAQKDPHVVPNAILRLCASIPVTITDISSHDALQAVVGGLAGAWWAAGHAERVSFAGTPPFRLDGTWREGYIIIPANSPNLPPDV